MFFIYQVQKFKIQKKVFFLIKFFLLNLYFYLINHVTTTPIITLTLISNATLLFNCLTNTVTIIAYQLLNSSECLLFACPKKKNSQKLFSQFNNFFFHKISLSLDFFAEFESQFNYAIAFRVIFSCCSFL